LRVTTFINELYDDGVTCLEEHTLYGDIFLEEEEEIFIPCY